MTDAIRQIRLSHVVLPLPNPVSDAKVLTGQTTPEKGAKAIGDAYRKLLKDWK